MKGLTYCWFVSSKSYFAVAAIVLTVTLGIIFGVMPHLDAVPIEIRHLVVFILAFAVMAIPAESLGKNLESYLKTGFADYLLSAMNKKSFVNALVLREVICIGFSLIGGYTVIISYLFSINFYLTAEVAVLVAFMAVLMSSIDFICTPLIIKMKSAEKAGLTAGLFVGLLIMIFMICVNVTKEGGFEELLVTMDFNIKGMLAAAGTALAACVAAYLITLGMVKRGDVC